jgi:hypothetical protein
VRFLDIIILNFMKMHSKHCTKIYESVDWIEMVCAPVAGCCEHGNEQEFHIWRELLTQRSLHNDSAVCVKK